MRIQHLLNKHKSQTIYVVGSGASLRVFPLQMLRHQVTIGLNKAWELFNLAGFMPRYSVTVHPELILEYEKGRSRLYKTQWITKRKPPLDKLELDDKQHYVFKSSEDLKYVNDLNLAVQEDTLFVGRGIQTTAMHLAHLMGARYIVLVGVDMGSLGSEHHATPQHVRFNGLEPKDVYREYYEWSSVVRDVLLYKGVPVLSMSAVIGEAWRGQDYVHLKKQLDLPDMAQPVDTSYYKRKGIDAPPKLPGVS